MIEMHMSPYTDIHWMVSSESLLINVFGLVLSRRFLFLIPNVWYLQIGCAFSRCHPVVLLGYFSA